MHDFSAGCILGHMWDRRVVMRRSQSTHQQNDAISSWIVEVLMHIAVTSYLFISGYQSIQMAMHSSMILIVAFSFVRITHAQVPDSGYSREELQPLTKFRQQHRKTIDGRLCALACAFC